MLDSSKKRDVHLFVDGGSKRIWTSVVALLWYPWRGWRTFWSSRAGLHHLLQLMILLAFFLLDTEKSVDVVDVGWPDLAQAFFDDGGRRSCGWIWEPEELGQGPDRWVTTVFILSFGTGVYFDSVQSLGMMRFLRFMVVFVFISDGVGRRRRRRL